MATQFANGLNPWGAAVQPKPTTKEKSAMPYKRPARPSKPAGSRIDPALLEIASDPMPTMRLSNNKYQALFAKLKVGQNIRCKPDDVQPLAQALRKYIDSHKITAKGKPVRVITQGNAPDGIGRVWLVEGAPKSQQLKAVA